MMFFLFLFLFILVVYILIAHFVGEFLKNKHREQTINFNPDDKSGNERYKFKVVHLVPGKGFVE